MKYTVVFLLCLILFAGCAVSSPSETEETPPATTLNTETIIPTTQIPTTETTQLSTGWITEDSQTCFIMPDGSRYSGWLYLDGTRYYLDENGMLQTGWLTLDGQTYYLQSDGSIAQGEAIIDGSTHFFTATGAEVMVANPWHTIPADYSPNLVEAENGYLVDSSCLDSLLQMLSDCRKAGYDAQITSAYRDHETQVYLFNRKVNYYLSLGYEEAAARKEAATIIAVPGTSEHELGLAVDLVDSSYWVLDEAQENTDAQKWLMEHCWEYGFILRYPNEKSDNTGIIYEPWHYRYVGTELAKILQLTNLCLEEYFDSLY